MQRVHRMPFGAELLDGQRSRFRLWAPEARQVHVELDCVAAASPVAMTPLGDGWFEAVVPGAGAGTLYQFVIDSDRRVPDPASRYQPQDVHGPSEVIDPLAFEWTDADWRGRPWREAVFYEAHVGTLTPPGSFVAMADRLDDLAELGITALELMPIADTPGRRNWGYDGCYLFAPEAAYGRPEDLKRLIDAAHRRGLMVFLDVVYNHFGPEGNYLHLYAPQFFTDRHETPWGAAINFDGGVRPVRDFFVHNALYWLEEFHIDGLRLDAVHAIKDDSTPDIVTELAEAVARHFGDRRQIHLVLENDHNAAGYLARQRNGEPRWYVAQWNDDIHHALHVLATGDGGGYYEDYAAAPRRHLVRCLTEGFAYQGEVSRHRDRQPRGEPSAHLPPLAFVGFLQNHDQIGNRALGERITALADAQTVRAVTAVLLLAPAPPLLFMGEEWAATQPFPFFCDFGDDLAEVVREGRRREFARFPEFRDPAARERIPDPNAAETFEQAVLDWSERRSEAGAVWLEFHRKLLRLRRKEVVPRLAGVGGHTGQAEWQDATGLMVSWRLPGGDRLVLAANLGPTALFDVPPVPAGRRFFESSEDMVEGLVARVWPAWSVAWFIVPGI